MPNTQITHDSDPNNARSESSLVVNPNDPMQIVTASKKFNNIYTYDFTLATEYSTDGGVSWHDSAPLAMPGFTVMTDPTMAWDDAGNVFLVGLAGVNPPAWDTIGIVIYKSSDGGMTWSSPDMIHKSSGDDKQWVAGDGNPASPHHGNVYAVWDDVAGIDFARTQDHGGTWIGSGSGVTAAGGVITSGSVYPEINVADDGAVYVVSIAYNQIKLLVSRDGGDTFQEATPPATGITTLGASLPYVGKPPYSFPAFPGARFRVLTDPTACAFGSTVMVAWADYREGVSRIYFACSTDGGATWITGPSGQPLLTASLPPAFQHFHPQIVTNPDGVVGCSFYEFGPKPTTPLIDVLMAQSFDSGASFNHFTVTDRPWDPEVNPPWSHGDSTSTFIGDYMGLDASARGFYPLWTDTRTGIQELWTAVVPERRCAFIVNRSTLGQDEVDALRKLAKGAGAVVADAFRVVVDGYSAAQIGVSGPASTLAVASPSFGMSISCTGNVSASGAYGPEVQRFTFIYDIDFGADPKDPAFGFSGETELLTLHAGVAEVSASAEIELIKQPNPFILHGDPAWLSIDLRVFVVRAEDSKFGVLMGPDASAAPDFIQRVAKALTDGGGSAAGQAFDDPAVLPQDEEQSALYLYPRDDANRPVFNFALARVRYIGEIGASDVRVFFRLFAAQTTSGAYDYPPGAHYRRAPSNPAGQPIPLAGIQGEEYVTIPFFALPRVDTTVAGMDQQTDSRDLGGGTVLGNVQRISAHGDGSEVDTFFGCWLDVNQPFSRVLPASRDAIRPDGPFDSPSNPPLSIQQAITRNLHQCLIAEVSFDPVAIPLGKDPTNWDKLAQRNLAWSDVGSATAVTTFEIRPTPVELAAGQMADELMIDWGELPRGAHARIYLPEVEADEILDMASRMYVSHGLRRVDQHTIACHAGGVTFVPVPPRRGADYAGLLWLDPPEGIRPGEQFTVVVRQVTNASSARLERPELPESSAAQAKGTPGELGALEGGGGRGGAKHRHSQWRRVLGGFQLTIPVKSKESLLKREERNLSVLRWIGESIPEDSRWHRVFVRYLDVMAGRVKTFGGDPTVITPSPNGSGPDHGQHHHQPAGPHSGESVRAPTDELEGRTHTGKVDGLIFDHFGDFDGFVLGTEGGERRYSSREREIYKLAERAWQQRLRVSVTAERDDDRQVSSIVVHEPPVAV